MRQLILLIAFSSIFNITAFAQDALFKDMPEKHWAEAYVGNLVKKGITSGFPDGTFRGLKNINRFEITAMLSKIKENSANLGDAEKILSELKSEFQIVKYQAEDADQVRFSGQFEEHFRFGNPSHPLPHGPKINSRIKLQAVRKFDAARFIKVNFDSMDSIYNGGSHNLAESLFDFEGRTKLGSFNLNASYGPGDITHSETDNVSPSDNGVVYVRNKPSIGLQYNAGNLGLSLSYNVQKTNSSGITSLNELNGTASYVYNSFPIFKKVKVSLSPRLFFENANRDLLTEIKVSAMASQALSIDAMLGIGSIGSTSGLLAGGSIYLSGDNTSLSIKAYKIGSEFRNSNKDKAEYLNYFSKNIADGTTDIGAELTQKLNHNSSLILISNIKLSNDFKIGKDYQGTSLTNEIKLASGILSVFYRNFYSPSTTPDNSDLIGISLTLF
ncbi:MAG: S-layer protein [Candidatus Saganbacteria bacterium]|uniref:S-layer protein n=1 Tax=Candidatus Saganbacteria bacterium TaxID=2575572 RepID=A0A833NYW7_UNCSA|nr:MAG: S-layer protein [Candidatus Saganbacteria bacterium]